MISASVATNGRGSRVKHKARSSKPSLSADKLSKHVLVEDLVNDFNNMSIRHIWPPHHVRFVMWYYLTTSLPYESIAVAFNVTFAGDDEAGRMEARNAEKIVELVNLRYILIKDELAARGQWPRPTEQGWAPCDHGMCCATLAEMAGNGRMASVMRSVDLKTRMARKLADMAMGLWDGDWEEILQCPRKHKDPISAGATVVQQHSNAASLPNSSKKSLPLGISSLRRSVKSSAWEAPSKQLNRVSLIPIFEEHIDLDLSSTEEIEMPGNPGTFAPIHPSTLSCAAAKTHSSLRKLHPAPQPRDHSTKMPSLSCWLNNRSLRSHRLNRAPMSDFQGEMQTFSDDPNLAPTESAGSTMSRSSNTHSKFVLTSSQNSARLTTTDSGSQVTLDGAANVETTRTEPIVTQINLVVGMPMSIDVSEVCSFVLKQAFKAPYWCIVLDPFEILAKNTENLSRHLVALSGWHFVQFLLAIFVTKVVVEYTFEYLRRVLRHRWMIELSPPHAPNMSETVYLLYLCIACQIVVFVWPKCAPKTQQVF
ncbi:uncharacterized protein Z519_08936 [Cladophialophora bantiana CBS 173.52]|uniref:Uncharacterized protein n=1 Tax=Cladophialophora bantiana (strain ATCC 10958 / CBS 173.52 / CDC B-1940 / NIH 8579) TaxID=1442370 RepID=A0A0D2FUR8_CLAB1|nr:uncharacterized protein Z519_08936 [Cladophialophora bantiana CBS 173.52]KIW90292.1 hypothetical protein Z519_08936 [Cladophialophora bantiana CBS 173.52]